MADHLLCSIESCEAVVFARGWCQKHWKRWRQHGDPNIVGRRGRPESASTRGPLNPNWRGGKTSHPLYWVYWDMVLRCTRPSHARWKDYGGRGITVCQRWRDDFWAFVEDMGPKRDDGVRYVLDRTDNDGNYEPSNCAWVTYSESAINRRRQGWESRERNRKGQFVGK